MLMNMDINLYNQIVKENPRLKAIAREILQSFTTKQISIKEAKYILGIANIDIQYTQVDGFTFPPEVS